MHQPALPDSVRGLGVVTTWKVLQHMNRVSFKSALCSKAGLLWLAPCLPCSPCYTILDPQSVCLSLLSSPPSPSLLFSPLRKAMAFNTRCACRDLCTPHPLTLIPLRANFRMALLRDRYPIIHHTTHRPINVHKWVFNTDQVRGKEGRKDFTPAVSKGLLRVQMAMLCALSQRAGS